MTTDRKCWALMFFAAGVFNLCTGGPIFFAPDWRHQLAYVEPADATALRFWSDFGYAVFVIGAGYFIVAANVDRNVGIVWLGVFAKLFDVIVLSLRWSEGVARPVVLIPAAIDGAFVLAFLLFLWRAHSANPRAVTPS